MGARTGRACRFRICRCRSDACLSIDSRELVEPVAQVSSLDFVGAQLERSVVGGPGEVAVADLPGELGPDGRDSVVVG